MIAATGLVWSWGCGDDSSPGTPIDAGPDGDADGGPAPDGPETDFEGPAAVVVFPPPASVTNAETITIRGTAGDATSVSAVTVNGTPATSTDGFATWTAEVSLGEGENDVVVATEDSLGNRAEEAARVRLVRAVDIAPSASAVTWDRVNNQAVVLDANTKSIFTVDPATRKRSLLSDGNTGAPALQTPIALGWDVDNARILVVDRGPEAEEGVEPQPAIIAVDPVSGARSVLSDAGRGSGPPLTSPTGVTWDEENGRALVLDGPLFNQVLVAIDESGAREVVADLGPAIIVGVALTWDEDLDRALVLDGFGKALHAVDVRNGSTALVSGPGDGGANEFSLPVAVTWDPVHKEAIVTDLGLDALLAVNVQTGTRAILVSPSVGTGAVPRSPVSATWDYAANRILVVDSELGAVLAVSADSGNAVVLSTAYHGAGPALRTATALSWDPENNRALLADATLRGVMAIDPATGDRTVLSAPSVGSGNQLVAPVALTWDESMSRVLVVDASPGVLVAIDPTTGQRIVLSDGTDGVQPDLPAPRAVAWDTYNKRAVVVNEQELVAIEIETGRRSIASRQGILGDGPGFMAPRAVAVWTSEPGNDVVFVADSAQSALFYVDIDIDTETTGDRAVLSDPSTGSGPNFERPISVAWDPAREQALVIDADLKALIGVDVVTGNRTIISSAELRNEQGDVVQEQVGKGPGMLAPSAVVWDPTSTRALVLDTELRAVLAVDPVTGERVILAR